MVHVLCCKIVEGELVCKSFGKANNNVNDTAATEVATLKGVMEDEEVETVSDTDTSTSVEGTGDEEKTGAESTSGAAVVATSMSAVEDISTSSTTEDEEDKMKSASLTAPDVAGVQPEVTATPTNYDMTSWYPHLKQLTAPTTFVSASKAEAQALILASNPKTAETANQGDLRTLEGKLDRAIEEQGGVVFIKLETRSPKDVLQSTSMMDRLRGLVRPTMKPADGHLATAERVAVANADTIAFVKGIRQLFKIRTGAEAIAMLKMSDRVKNDLDKGLGRGDGSSLICVRRWRDVDAAREFRAFVHNKKLTACSQYCYYQCFPELLTGKSDLSRRIEDFFNNQVLPALPYADAVLDFHVSDDLIEIIELSAFSISTGACMFSWKQEEDKKILEEGPFAFRVLEEAKKNPYECLPSRWQTWFEQERGFNLRGNTGDVSLAKANNNNAAPAAASSQPPALPKGNPPAPKKEKKWTFGKFSGREAKKKQNK
jgi:hypothetical protein